MISRVELSHVTGKLQKSAIGMLHTLPILPVGSKTVNYEKVYLYDEEEILKSLKEKNPRAKTTIRSKDIMIKFLEKRINEKQRL